MTQNIKHIFFDLDHTLWDFETNSNKTFEQIFDLNKIILDFEEFKSNYQPINQKYWKLYRDEKVSKEDLRYGRLKDTFDRLNYPITDNQIYVLAKEYIDFLPHHNLLFEGALELLNYLKPKYQLHIITNGFEEVQNKKLSNSNLLPYFKHIITSERVGVKKPNPKIFEYSLNLTGANASESIMIGDNLEADILGAEEVGLDTILVDFDKTHRNNTIKTVSSLHQIRNFL